MSPRPYRMSQRLAGTEQTRARIIDAARELLISDEGAARFTVEAIAKAAGVARMTVYYQFGSKRGLLEALFDALAERGLVGRLPAIYTREEPLESLSAMVEAFCGFWHSDRLVIRRVRALAALDAEVAASIRDRDELRRQHSLGLVRRLWATQGAPNLTIHEGADLLSALTSFETFDALATDSRDWRQVAALIDRTARMSLGLSADSSPSRRG